MTTITRARVGEWATIIGAVGAAAAIVTVSMIVYAIALAFGAAVYLLSRPAFVLLLIALLAFLAWRSS